MGKRKRAHSKTRSELEAKKTETQPENANASVEVIQSAPIFNLIDDCCFHIFSWLSRKDLEIFGETCKWANRVIGEHHQRNYSAFEWNVTANRRLNEYIGNVMISRGHSLEPYRNIETNSTVSITQLGIFYNHLSRNKIEYLKETLSKLDSLKLYHCSAYGEFYAELLNFCTSLKRLYLGLPLGKCLDYFEKTHFHDGIMIGTGNDWLLRKYPTLEHLELCQPEPFKINELKSFFDQNPNIRSFGINDTLLLKNKESLLSSEALIGNVVSVHQSGK